MSQTFWNWRPGSVDVELGSTGNMVLYSSGLFFADQPGVLLHEHGQ
jgi:hypothetical protein